MPEIVVPLTIRPLTHDDLPAMAWYGPPTALAAVAEAIDRAHRGEVDYLAVCPPSGRPVAVGGADYTKPPGAATIWQLSVLESLQSCGIGTLLIHALEDRIRARGLRWAELGVDINAARPQVLYERLGYTVSGSETASWNQESADGTVSLYETQVTLLRKDLQAVPEAPGES
ncbi:GNAT family N-acetyltransferase [Kribbella solani]|uniref:Ribosomal protein S18 acetylase RimI-like enzyme n=1 Tax=Kribbella solani TaxID=236067 RepID=A0A841DMD6_9ACTN|nr:GNAT family N-acetyltransferase [Kribbella solani]MBB5978175.1 ribosomal protein S18 acetylase RimI-like enzyme [Kribbella solani]